MNHAEPPRSQQSTTQQGKDSKMCSTPKSSSTTKLKNIRTSPFTNNNLSDFVSIANAADARQEERERLERERLKLEEAVERQLSRSVETQLTKSTQVESWNLSTMIVPAITRFFPGKFAIVKTFIDNRI